MPSSKLPMRKNGYTGTNARQDDGLAGLPGDPRLARDPVCGMTVDPHTTMHRHEHAGRTYYFCSSGCGAKFAADPTKYLSPSAAADPVPEGTIYTCPMHPQ